MNNSDRLNQAMAESRKKIERKRVKVRPFVKGRPRGRPIKHSGVYFTRSILVDDATFFKIQKHKRLGEPLGSVVRRLVGIAEQKKVIATDSLEFYQPDSEWNDTWKEAEEMLKNK